MGGVPGYIMATAKPKTPPSTMLTGQKRSENRRRYIGKVCAQTTRKIHSSGVAQWGGKCCKVNECERPFFIAQIYRKTAYSMNLESYKFIV